MLPQHTHDHDAGQYLAVESAFSHGRVMTEKECAAFYGLNDAVTDEDGPVYVSHGYTLAKELHSFSPSAITSSISPEEMDRVKNAGLLLYIRNTCSA